MKRNQIWAAAFAVAFLLIHAISFAQDTCSYRMRGFIRDADTREPLGFSNVVIVELQKGAASNDSGYYELTGICSGTYTVRVSHLSCESREFRIVLSGNLNRDFELPHRHNELVEICVTGEMEQPVSTVATLELTGAELDRTRGGSLAESLENLSGVTSLKTGSNVSKPVIHGLQGNRVLILNNGIRQEGQQWGNEHAPEIDPFIARKLTVIKGAGSVRYGSDAIAGVILVEPDDLPSDPGINAEMNLAGYSNNREGVVSAIVEQNFKKLPALSWRLQGTLKHAGNTKTPGYYLKNTAYRERNFSAAAGWNKATYGADVFYSQFNSEIGIFTGSHIGNLTDLQEAFTRPKPLESSEFSYTIERPSQNAEHELAKIRLWLSTGDVGKLSAVYARQYNLRFEFDRDAPLNDSLAALNQPDLTYEITTHTLDLNWEHHNIRNFRGIAGVSSMYQANTFEGRLFIPNYENYVAGVFLIERWTKGSIQIEGGLRWDMKQLTVYERKNLIVEQTGYDYSKLSGSLGLLYEFSDHTIFTLNAGTGWRSPGVNEMYSNGLHHGAAAVEVGDKNLKVEQSLNLIAGINFHDHRTYKIEAAVYANRFDNFIYLQPVVPATLTIQGAFPTYRYRQADAFHYGFDVIAEYRLNRMLTATGKAALVRAENLDTDDFLPGMPADRFEYGLRSDFRSLKRINGIYLSARMQHVTRQSRVPDAADYVAAPDGYSLLGAELGFELNSKRYPVKFTVSVNNLLNERYRDYLNRYRYFADEEGRNVMVRVKIPVYFKKS